MEQDPYGVVNYVDGEDHQRDVSYDDVHAHGHGKDELNLTELCEQMYAELKSGASHEVVRKLMQQYNGHFYPHEWSKFAHWDTSRYTRNLVAHNDQFTLLLLCWNRELASPIHDHAQAHCMMKVLQGELVETKYEWPVDEASPPTEIAKTHASAGDVVYIHDSIGLHKVANNSAEVGAVSLHCYFPPIIECKVFNERDGTVINGKTTWFSIAGERCPVAVTADLKTFVPPPAPSTN